jgi:hypothetical protein
MKALTLHQPWASLVAVGAKTIETRSWSTRYRGPLAIHAAKMSTGPVLMDGVRVLNDAGYQENPATRSFAGPSRHQPLPLGAILATCTLVDVVATDTMDGFERIEDGRWRGRPHTFEEACDRVDGLTWLDEHEPPCDYGGRAWDLAANRPFGDFTPGRFAWLMADIEPVLPPVPARGFQQLWEWDGA